MKTQPYKNLWDAPKAVLGGSSMVTQAQPRKPETLEQTALTYYLQVLEKEQNLKSAPARKQ